MIQDIQKADKNIKIYTEKLINKTHDITVYRQVLVEIKEKAAQEAVSYTIKTIYLVQMIQP